MKQARNVVKPPIVDNWRIIPSRKAGSARLINEIKRLAGSLLSGRL